MRPVDEVVGLHEDESAVIAPSALLYGTLEGCFEDACALAEDMQVRHREVEGSVGRRVM